MLSTRGVRSAGDSIVLADSWMGVKRKLVRSADGNGPQIFGSKGMIPKWQRVKVDKNTGLNLLFRNHRQATDSHGRNQINEASSD